MNLFTIAIPCVLVASAALVVPSTQEMGKTKPQDAKPQDAAAMPPMPKPGPEHAALKLLEGTWDANVEHIMKPGDPPTKSKGVEVNKLVCNGLWIQSDVTGEMGTTKFEGHGHFGWDSFAKKYRSTWVDNMGTYLAVSEGTFDDKTKTITMTSEMPDMTGKLCKFRMVDQIKGNERTMTSYQVGADGKESVHMTIQYKKK